jgi:3-phosphoshikimate 1-carboxyvinyltransferase
LTTELRRASRGLKGQVTPPPDKSISHRAVILASLAKGRSVIRNFLRAGDTMSTVGAFRSLGVSVSEGEEMVVEGRGLRGLKEPMTAIYCGNSGTTMRLLSGVLSGNPFFSVLTGDESLSRRPMGRIITPLRKMGASIMARDNDAYAPIAIRGGGLRPLRYESPVASAQVKSAVLLAGLYADGETEVIEPFKSRDHTERMLSACGARVEVKGLAVKVWGAEELQAAEFFVPGDISSAAFFMAAALLVEGSEITVRSVGVNPTRTGIVEVLKRMGAEVETLNRRDVSGEPIADLAVRHSPLRAVEIGAREIPSVIDEFPALCVLASQAEGTTSIRGARELRVKESDRIGAVAEGLRRMGADVLEHDDGLSITGRAALRGARIDSRGDHRIAMAFAVAALVSEGTTTIEKAEAVDISFPGFFDILRELTG